VEKFMDGRLKPKRLKDFFLFAYLWGNKNYNNINILKQKPHSYWPFNTSNQKYPGFINILHAWVEKSAVFRA
jgi:hypothetical protein